MENSNLSHITKSNTQLLHIDIPLVVDLDGSLINTDILYENMVLLIKKNPFYIFLCFIWLIKGKVYLKYKIFSIVRLNLKLLPYNLELIDFLKKEHEKGRKIILATASLKSNAVNISKLYPIFDDVYGTESINLKGKNKSRMLISLFGKSNFDYIGNSYSDLPIFASSRYSYLVNPTVLLERKTKKISNLQYTWRFKKSSVLHGFKAVRAYQWIKNVLIFVPLITSHSFNSINLTQAIGGFIAFSFVASSGYLINDLLDLESDRLHLRKRFRPLASGKLSIPSAGILALSLLAGGLFLASKLSTPFLLILIFYFIVSFSYSIHLKKLALYDVFILASLYSIRVIAGAIVIGVPVSFWLIAFSTFIFLSLALVKRYSELIQVKAKPDLTNKAREYSIEDLNLLQIMGIVSGFLSIVVFSLYIDSPEVALLYSRPKLLWTISLLFLFWISRIWLITTHGKMADDPIVFAIKDKSSYLIFSFIGLILFLSV